MRWLVDSSSGCYKISFNRMRGAILHIASEIDSSRDKIEHGKQPAHFPETPHNCQQPRHGPTKSRTVFIAVVQVRLRSASS